MHRTVVLDVVGLTPALLGDHTPNLNRLISSGGVRELETITPAVTCSVQSTFVTGALPGDHGCVANGWYFRDLCEVLLWRQPEGLVEGEKLWDAGKARDPGFTCAKHFWWYNMYSTADYTVTPRPMYPADGRKIPDVYTFPPGLRDELNADFGAFPLFDFWGPTADITSSQWIADTALHIFETRQPTLTLVYLPHLDYCLQRLGPNHPAVVDEVARIDGVAGRIIEHVQRAKARVIVLSEYGITEVSGPVHINRALREAGLLTVREELGRELLDAGVSDAFAVADHQIAHVYVRRPELVTHVARLLGELDGVEEVLGAKGKRRYGLDHSRSGELVALAEPDRWFTYYYWRDDEAAPDFARTVDIHRKPGYDPVELFVDPELWVPQVRIGIRLLQKTAGFRTLMDVIPLDATLVKGSHGRSEINGEHGPVFISSQRELLPEGPVGATAVKDLILDHVFGS